MAGKLTIAEIQAEIDRAEPGLMALADLVPAEVNARRNTRAAKALAEAITEVGWGAPPLVQRGTNRLIAGHTRLKAAQQLGLERLPVLVLDVDDRRAKALQLADNRLGELAEWDWPELAQELSAFGLDEVERFGFDSKYLEDLAERVPGFGPLEIKEDEVPEPPRDPVTKPGDVWTLGDHMLVCGSCIDVLPKLGMQYDLLLSDPPYGVDHSGGTKDPRDPLYKKGKAVHNDGADQIHTVGIAGLSAAHADLKPGGCMYVTAPAGPNGAEFIAWMLGCGLRQILVWVKDTFVFGRSDYHYRHELILYGWKPGAAHHEMPDRKQDTVWEIERPKRADPQGDGYHPTRKPVELFARAIFNSTKGADLVCDPFMGSGTSLIAAEQLGRKSVGTEIDPGYCDVIVERWTTLTGKPATRKNV